MKEKAQRPLDFCAFSLLQDHESCDHQDPDVDRVDHVKHILTELCILTSFSVVEEYEEDSQEHCPLVVVA